MPDMDDAAAAHYNVAALYGRAVAWMRLGAHDRAIQDFDRAITIDPLFSDAFFGRGIAHLKARKYVAAVADFDANLKLSPRNAFALYGRGLANRSRGDAATSDADIAAAIQINSGLVQTFGNLFDL
jgi:tetratricopeptide (TPR) repeat protein